MAVQPPAAGLDYDTVKAAADAGSRAACRAAHRTRVAATSTGCEAAGGPPHWIISAGRRKAAATPFPAGRQRLRQVLIELARAFGEEAAA
jgi:hypothetical protein